MQSFSLPLFDRLRQDAPDHIGLSDLHASLALDLDRLINTRSMQTGDSYLANELPDYGVPDFSIRLLRTQADRQVIETLVAAAIRRYEPRLLLDEVRFVFPETDPRRGHFRISGTLNVQPRREHVTFEIEVETAA